MSPDLLQSKPSRRDLVRGLAAAGLATHLALAPGAGFAQDDSTNNYSGHPAVGIWIEGGPTFTYAVYHADGTSTYYNPWPAAFPVESDPKLPVYGFGLWKPTGDRTFEGPLRIAWGDTSVNTLMTLWGRGEVDESGAVLSTEYRFTAVDSLGKKIAESQGTATAWRFEWEPFEVPAVPDATPAM